MTLLELLIGMVLGLGVLAAMSALLGASLQSWRRADAGAEAREALADALDQLDRDVRLAGYDPTGSGLAGIVDASAQSLEVEADLDGNGMVDADSEEHVTYRCARDCETLERVVGRQVMPLVSGLEPGMFRLRYFDERDREVAAADAATRATIRRVTVRAATRDAPGLPLRELTTGARPLNR
jgi:type II secretory pathway component PulJ